MDEMVIAWLHIGIAVLLMGLSVPLILRKVPMNDLYGVRFRASFKSERAWYEINAYGGKVLLGWAMPTLFVGIYSLWQSELPSYFSLVRGGVLVVSMIAACVQSFLGARRIDKEIGGT
jgi:hypothetical protein